MAGDSSMTAPDAAIDLCVFDLDHTLVHSDLDLDRVRRDVLAHLRRRGVAVPPGEPLPPIADLLKMAAIHDARHGSDVAAEAWRIVAEHERRALAAARAEPGALETLQALRARGCRLAVWTNNAAATARLALARSGLEGAVDVLVTRDDVQELKPAPDGFAVVVRRLVPGRARVGDGDRARVRQRAIVVGDSWIDGAAAAAAGVRFVAFRTPEAVFAERGVAVWYRIERLPDLLHLPGLGTPGQAS